MSRKHARARKRRARQEELRLLRSQHVAAFNRCLDKPETLESLLDEFVQDDISIWPIVAQAKRPLDDDERTLVANKAGPPWQEELRLLRPHHVAAFNRCLDKPETLESLLDEFVQDDIPIWPIVAQAKRSLDDDERALVANKAGAHLVRMTPGEARSRLNLRDHLRNRHLASVSSGGGRTTTT